MQEFANMGLQQALIDAVSELGFETPTEIQEKAIPVFLRRETDLVALAQTGTGKTASFGLPILHHLNVANRFPQALVIAPTRELCLQITNDLKNYSKYLKGVQIVAVYGGSSISTQIRELKSGAQIVVATPGRLIDLLDRKALKLDQVNTVVLDEADEMLNMGFQEDIETILAQTPSEKITGLFSATMPKAIRQIASQYLNETVEVSAGKKNCAKADIQHQYAVVHAKDKLAALKRIIDFNESFFGIVFCTTRIETQEISDTLMKAGYNADCLHGDLSQQQRDKVMARFRRRNIKVLCATDVAARGIDVNDITHVIHYHLPDDIENYTHRSGRTARAGKKGISIALLHIREAYKLHQIEKLAGVKFEKFLIPKGDEIIARRINQFVEAFIADVPEDVTPVKNEWIYPLMQLSKEELVMRIVQKECRSLDQDYTQHADLNVDEQKKSTGRERDGRKEKPSGTSRRDRIPQGEKAIRFFINLGKKDGIRYDEMRELIFQQSRVSGHHIKDISMQPSYSFFETDAANAERITKNFRPTDYRGREVKVHLAEGGAPKPSERSGSDRRKTRPGANGGGNKPRFRQRNDDTSW